MNRPRHLLTLSLAASALGSACADRVDFGPGSFINTVPGGVMIVQTDQAPNASLPFLLTWIGGPQTNTAAPTAIIARPTTPTSRQPTTRLLAQSGNASSVKLAPPSTVQTERPVQDQSRLSRAALAELQPADTMPEPAVLAQASVSRPISATVSAPSSVSSADPAPARTAAPAATPSYASTRPTGDDVGSSTPSWLRGRFTATKGTSNTTILYSLNNLSANTDVSTRISGITIRLNGEVLNGASLSRTTTSQNLGTLNGGSMETGAIRLPANAKGTLSLDWALESSESKQLLHRTWTLN